MAYEKLIDNLSTSIEKQLEEISTRYNFDYGDEFEIAICELLSKILPAKYGICRGFVVTETDDFGGDDIIIYDKDRFPTLRLLGENKFEKKQDIPVEAVYAYIEAKHTLFLKSKTNGQSIFKAYKQIHDVKNLVREKSDLLSIDPYTSLGKGFTAKRDNWPNYSNPIYGCIIARFVKDTPRSKIITSDKLSNSIKAIELPTNILFPDLVILGQNDMLLPCIPKDGKIIYESPFLIENASELFHTTTKTSSLALGITMLLYALDSIKLGKMPYKKIIGKQLK
ncbi:hypothetical protein KIH23_13505 [Flavobacterium sp. CYK-55]|uniref:DUF6602 domain-containing protein n=1 Tax=Flavobacterium sp. CYK-55 TaxID=2835529 RepID=UPI001BCE5B0F|nr:DUF6602 domain-containing protein [Flavobacterium sp. CYK-55]MBS7788319.1 hypothetical protein [Flavobacterium sp. CYK-55]